MTRIGEVEMVVSEAATGRTDVSWNEAPAQWVVAPSATPRLTNTVKYAMNSFLDGGSDLPVPLANWMRQQMFGEWSEPIQYGNVEPVIAGLFPNLYIGELYPTVVPEWGSPYIWSMPENDADVVVQPLRFGKIDMTGASAIYQRNLRSTQADSLPAIVPGHSEYDPDPFVYTVRRGESLYSQAWSPETVDAMQRLHLSFYIATLNGSQELGRVLSAPFAYPLLDSARMLIDVLGRGRDVAVNLLQHIVYFLGIESQYENRRELGEAERLALLMPLFVKAMEPYEQAWYTLADRDHADVNLSSPGTLIRELGNMLGTQAIDRS